MSNDPFHAVAEAHRETARSALTTAFGPAPIAAVTPVTGGASGASIFRVEAGGRRYLLRLEGPASPLLRRNPHRHACTRMAAEAGIAPAVHYLDEACGVTVTDFIEQRPLRSFPGGPRALARALGALLGRLQAMPAFPQLVYYPDLVTRMLDHVRGSGVFAAGLLDEHVERLAGLRAACDWDETSPVSSHNDPNPGNILFDGVGLWLIDWESAYRNHPLVDVAIVLDSLAPTPELEDVLLEAWLGRGPDEDIRARLALIRPLTRLYYACFLLNAGGAVADADLSAPSLQAFAQAIGEGRLKPDAPQTAHTLGKMFLSGFLTGGPAPGLAEAVAAVAGEG